MENKGRIPSEKPADVAKVKIFPKRTTIRHYQTQLPVRWKSLVKCLCNDCELIRSVKEADIAELKRLKDERLRHKIMKSSKKKIDMIESQVKQKEFDVQDAVLAEQDHKSRSSLKRDVIYADKVDAVSGWENLKPQNEEIDAMEEQFEGIQDALERRGKDESEKLGEEGDQFQCFELETPPKEIVDKEDWESFYEPVPNTFREHRKTGRQYQIYKVRCVGEKNAFCIFLGPNFTHPWFVVPKGG